MPGRNCCNKEEIFIIGFLDFAGWQWKDDWWRRGESHFYRKYWCVLIIFTSKIRLAPTVAPRREQL